MKYTAIRQAVAKQLGWKKLRGRKYARRMAKRLGAVAVAGGMSLGLASDGYAVTIPDAGFEDHVIDDATGYAYGAAGQAGDPDGFNNPSSAGGGVSPWQALASGGNGIGGDNASWIQNSGYQAPNTGDQSAEVQGLFAQNLTATFAGGMAYIATVAADANGGDNDVVISLYDAGAVTFLPTSTPDLILNEPSLVVPTPVVFGGGYSDAVFTFRAADLAALVGQNIGIAIYSPDVGGQGPRIDDVRLDAFPEEEVFLGIEVNKTTGTITMMNGGTTFAHDINYYEIASSGDSNTLSNGWNSFADQMLDSQGANPEDNWQEGGGSDSNLLTEAFLGSSEFAFSETQTLANAYSGGAGGAEDLVFSYGLDDGRLVEGLVSYVTSAAVAGDYSGNGIVGAEDYTIWRDNLGAADESAFAPGTGNGGPVDASDYTFWKGNFGNTSGSGSLATAEVPEPASLVLVAGLGGLLIAARRRS